MLNIEFLLCEVQECYKRTAKICIYILYKARRMHEEETGKSTNEFHSQNIYPILIFLFIYTCETKKLTKERKNF